MSSVVDEVAVLCKSLIVTLLIDIKVLSSIRTGRDSLKKKKKFFSRFLSEHTANVLPNTFFSNIFDHKLIKYDFVYSLINARMLVSGLFCFEIPKAGDGS